MDKQINITIPDGLAKRMTKRKKNVSEAALQDILSYYAIIDATTREMKTMFSQAEAAFICEIFKNTDIGIERFEEWPTLFAWDVEDVERCEKLGRRFEVDACALIEKLESLKPHQSLWLMDRIRLFRCTEEAKGLAGEVLNIDFQSMD
ncbi:MAG: hypothetical protein M0P57_06760 [Syntrophales bacterium]|jgi:hypothetical protein|nr:hypothetical protein [Syntrophales bacterium]MDY0043621.1 hypothetical protein [Syntrophales bacterium]